MPRNILKKEIIINAALDEVRIAITEDGKLAELFIELPDKERAVGSVYLGKVTKVVQGQMPEVQPLLLPFILHPDPRQTPRNGCHLLPGLVSCQC